MTESTKSLPSAAAEHQPGQAASIVVVNYNGRDLLADCLSAALPQANALGAEIVVVDNASTDASVQLVRERFPSVRVLEAPRNLGFAGGCNAGVRAATNDLVVLLNNDAVPDPGWLEALLAALDPPDVAVACSVVHDRDYAEAYALGTGSLSVLGHPIAGAMRQHDRPFYTTGAALALKRHVCGADPFPAGFFAYYEDVLLAWRLRLQGYQVARALGSHVQHLGSATASRMPERAFYLRERNKLITLLVCYEGRTLARLLPLYLLDGLVRLLEDAWAAANGRRAAQKGAPPFVGKYALLLRALGWLLLNADAVGRQRMEIQRERRVSDAAITPMLSGKIFDDIVTSQTHSLANRAALDYCRAAGIRTFEI
jgi:GT2 family glycosyltransferase